MRIDKVVCLGMGKCGCVYCHIKYDDKRLSITGVEGPMANGNARGNCGQIVMSRPVINTLSKGWTQELIRRFWEVWDKWHLNDMRAECEHQQKLGWTFATHEGKKCPTCGYLIGSKWLFEEIPQDILIWLDSLPESEYTPAWI